MFDREYTVVAHPRLRARVSTRGEDGDLDAATIRLDYRRDEQWTEEGTAVSLPEHPDESGVEWQGVRFVLYRDGERLLAEDVSTAIVSDLREALTAVERHAPTVARRGRALVQRAVSRTRRREHRGENLAMVQPDGSTVEALAPPAQATFELYEADESSADDPARWRWRLRHDNGNVLAESDQAFSSRRDAERAVRSVKRNALGAGVETADVEAES